MDGVYVPKPLNRLNNHQVLLGLATMTAVALFAALWSTRAINPLRGDTYEYLYFDASRSVGYPAFLALIRLITGQVALAVPAQTLLLAGSLLTLAWSFHKFCGRPSLSFVFQAIVLSLAAMWYDSAFLMAEAISTALVAIWCVQLLCMIKATPSLRGAALLVAVSGLATMVRPSLVPLFLGTAVFIFVAQPARERRRALYMAGAGLILAWGATPVAQLLIHGSAKTTSPFARGVLQHTLFCSPGAIPRDADSLFVEQSAAPVRRYIETAPPDMQRQFRRSYSTLLRMGLIIPVLGRRHHLNGRSQVDPYLSRIAGERVKANPSCYVRSVVGEYARMTIFDSDPTTDDARRMNTFIATHPPFEVTQYPRLPGDEHLVRQAANEVHNQASGLQPKRQNLKVIAKAPFLVILPLRLIFGGAALVGVVSLLALPFRQRLAPQLQRIVPATAAMGVAFHGALAITAIVEIGFFRYLVPVWPIVCTLFAVAVVGVIEAAPRFGKGDRRFDFAKRWLVSVFHPKRTLDRWQRRQPRPGGGDSTVIGTLLIDNGDNSALSVAIIAPVRPRASKWERDNIIINMKSAPALLVGSAICIAATPASAKSDHQLWAIPSATVKLSDHWRLSEEFAFRFSDNRNGLYEIESNTLIGYRLNKVVTVWGGYTHDPQYTAGHFTVMEHRAREQVTFDGFAQPGKGKLSGRLRLEQRWREHLDGTGWRFRPYIKYSLPIAGKTALNLSNETFVNLNTTPFQRKTGVDRMRNLISMSTPLSKTLTGEAGYMNQHGFVRGGPDTNDNIAYFGFALSL